MTLWKRLSASLSTLGITAALLTLGPSTGAAALVTSWDAAADFSATSNPNGAWSYGWSAARGSAFTLDTVATTVSGLNVWTSPGNQVEPDVFFNGTTGTITPRTNPIPAGTLAFHPGPFGQNAVVRWTAPTAGSYNVQASFIGRDMAGPTTTDVAVLANGKQLWAGEVTAYLATQPFSAGPLNLNAGDTIDFTVGYGSDHTYFYDSTGLSAAISLPGDTTPPVVAITSPAQGGTYILNQGVVAAYACTDPDSISVTCVGPVPTGGPVDTTTVGSKTFTVLGTDQAGNAASASATYSVSYGICWFYDQTKAVQSGATVPIKLALCDANNVDLSSPAITLTAVAVTQVGSGAPGVLDSPGNSSPDHNFQFDPDLGTNGGYHFNLSTTNLTSGTYALGFTVSGDPTQQTALFRVK